MCEHYRAPKYHGPYISGRCPDCGSWVTGISSQQVHEVEVVAERDVPRATLVIVRDHDGDEHRGARIWDDRFHVYRIQVGMTTYPLDFFPEIKELGEEFESPWAGILPVR